MGMIRMSDFEEQEWALGRSYLSIGRWEGERCRSRESNFRSPHGIVEVYEWIGGGKPITSMRFIHQGREFVRRWGTSWGDKTLARLAREFVESVVSQQPAEVWSAEEVGEHPNVRFKLRKGSRA